MIVIAQAGPGSVNTASAVRDSKGKSLLPVQAAVTGTASFRLMGRVSPEGRWHEIKAPSSADFLECISWCPYLRLEVLSGDGTVKLWIGEQ